MTRNAGALQARKRNKRILVEKCAGGIDGFGHKTVGAEWREYCRAWVSITFGSGGEQREAAQNGGNQTATFYALANDMADSISVRDRIRYPLSDPDPKNWPAWEINAVAELGFNEGYAFTATRVAS